MPNVRWLLRLVTAVHRFLYVRSGGRFGGRALWIRFLLLVHAGRKSGRLYSVPLLYVEDGEKLVIVASNAGDAREPEWWRNLQARPEAEARVGRRALAVRARAAVPAERERLWPKLEAAYPYYRLYRQQAHREIPVVVLEPRPA
jgi:deazaflavin-dependent oxidoreductase (nitroreductase family)